MVRLPATGSDREHDINATMTPMIDVVFLLLIFFVWTAGTQVVEYLLPTQVSSQVGNQPAEISEPLPEQDFDNVLIRLRWDGNLPDWSINEQPVPTIQDLTTTLTTLAEVNINAKIIVHPDENVPMNYVIEVFDHARMCGFVSIQFALNKAVQR